MERRVRVGAAHRFLICGDYVVVLVALAVVSHRAVLGQFLRALKSYLANAAFVGRGGEHAQLNGVYRLSHIAAAGVGNVLKHSVLYIICLVPLGAYIIKCTLDGGNYIFSRDKFEFKHGRAAENRVVYIKIRVLGRRRYKRYVAVFYVFEQRLLLLFIKILDLVEIEQNAVWRDKCVELRDNVLYVGCRGGRAV